MTNIHSLYLQQGDHVKRKKGDWHDEDESTIVDDGPHRRRRLCLSAERRYGSGANREPEGLSPSVFSWKHFFNSFLTSYYRQYQQNPLSLHRI